ncbi:MAG: alanine racemase [Campylobacterales bacterium]
MATLYLSQSALRANLKRLREKNPNIYGVIKDNGYGHGLLPIAKMLHQEGVKRVVVRDNREGERILPLFEEILILYPHTGRSYRNLSYAINSIEQLRKNRHPYIHLKIDTGMHRAGLSPSQLPEALKLIEEKGLELRGVFTHFCCADQLGADTFIALHRFKDVRREVEEFCQSRGWSTPIFHWANSAAVELLPPEELGDYIRPGIALYGGIEGYQPVAKLVGKVILTRKLERGEGVGYYKRFKALKPMDISLIDVGYGDGIPYFKNGAILKETRALGQISMDSMVVEGRFSKEVVIFDDVREFAKNFETITYDILVKLHPRIHRVIVH